MWMRRPNLVTAALITIAALRIASTYTTFSLTTDEPIHIGAGLELLQQHTYVLQPVNPPLPRIVLAAIPSLSGMRWGDSRDFYRSAADVFYTGGRYLTKLVLIRVGNLLFFAIAAIALFAWARLELGASAALLATFLFTTQPVILGYSGIANHDVPGTAGVAVALLALAHWLRKPDAMRASILGAAYGFSILCKFSSIPYVPVACAAIFAVRIIREPGLRRPRAIATLLLVPIVAAAVIWAGYAFTFGPVSGTRFSAPAPAFFRGLGDLMQFDRDGFVSYAFEKISRHGFWWYFPAAVLLKTTLPVLVLTIGGGWFACRAERFRWTFVESVLAALAIIAVAIPSTLDLGVRYVLPVYVPMTLAATAAAMALLEISRKAIRLAAVLLLALQAVVSIAAHPDYFPYFNALAGNEPGRYLVDSNLDWGQDTLRLKKAARRLRIERIGLAIPGNRTSNEEFDAIGLPPNYGISPYNPRHGWLAVGEHFYRVDRDGWRWLDAYPMQRIGKSIRLYHIPKGAPGTQELEKPSEQVLLPIAGTEVEQGAPGGARWRVDQTVQNRGTQSVHLSRTNCPGSAACEFDLAPGQSQRIAGSDPIRPFIYVSVPHDVIDDIAFTTVARRVDRNVPGSDLVVPAVRKSEFRERKVEFDAVPFSRTQRLNLRLYSEAGSASTTATIRVAGDRGVVAERIVPISITGYFTHGDFASLFPGIVAKDKGMHVTIDAGQPSWAFITATDAEGRSTVYLPK